MSEVQEILSRVDNAVSTSLRGVLDPIQSYIEDADSKMALITSVMKSLPEFKALKDENERLKARLEALEQGLQLEVSVPPARPVLAPLTVDHQTDCICPSPITRGQSTTSSLRALEDAVTRDAEQFVNQNSPGPSVAVEPNLGASKSVLTSPQEESEASPKVVETDLVEIEIAEEDEEGNEFDRTYFTDDEINGLLYEKGPDGVLSVVGRFVEGDPEFTAFSD